MIKFNENTEPGHWISKQRPIVLTLTVQSIKKEVRRSYYAPINIFSCEKNIIRITSSPHNNIHVLKQLQLSPIRRKHRCLNLQSQSFKWELTYVSPPSRTWFWSNGFWFLVNARQNVNWKRHPHIYVHIYFCLIRYFFLQTVNVYVKYYYNLLHKIDESIFFNQ